MKQSIIAIVLGTCLLTSSASGQQKRYWTTFYKEERAYITRQDFRDPFVETRCTVTSDKEQLKSFLQKVKWPFRKTNPSINWEEDIAIIIAPGEVHSGFRLAFRDLAWTGKEFILKWGWWDPSSKQYWGSRTYSTGFGPTPPNEVLIVAIKRYVYTANKLVCQEYDAASPG